MNLRSEPAFLKDCLNLKRLPSPLWWIDRGQRIAYDLLHAKEDFLKTQRGPHDAVYGLHLLSRGRESAIDISLQLADGIAQCGSATLAYSEWQLPNSAAL